jgi:hypothetical protein
MIMSPKLKVPALAATPLGWREPENPFRKASKIFTFGHGEK